MRQPLFLPILSRLRSSTGSWQTRNAGRQLECQPAWPFCWLCIRKGKNPMKKSSVSSRRVVRLELNAENMKRIARKHAKALTALAQRPDEEIDLSDIPEIKDWSGAVMGKFY